MLEDCDFLCFLREARKEARKEWTFVDVEFKEGEEVDDDEDEVEEEEEEEEEEDDDDDDEAMKSFDKILTRSSLVFSSPNLRKSIKMTRNALF